VSSPAAKGEEVPPAEHRGAHAPGVLRYGAGLYLTTFLALLGFACAQELWAGFWQDRCSFGPVSNERYRELLSQAQAMRRTQGALLDQRNTTDPVSGRRRSANQLRLAELAKSATSLEERIATAHAMMRAERFMLRSTFPDEEDPYRTATTLVAFDYERFHLFGLAFLCLIDCKDRASVNLLRETEPGEPSDIVLRSRSDWLTFRNPEPNPSVIHFVRPRKPDALSDPREARARMSTHPSSGLEGPLADISAPLIFGEPGAGFA
jgi:hypothetical protein